MSNKIVQPIPQGKYLPAIRHGDVVYTSGMTPRKEGKLMYSGEIKANEPIETYKDPIQLATLNALVAAQLCLEKGEKISQIFQLNIYLNAEKIFTSHAKIADYASDLLIEILGDNCIGSRTAIGVASLPSNAPVEISLTAIIDNTE